MRIVAHLQVDEGTYSAYMNTYGDQGSLIEEAEQKYREAQETVHVKYARDPAVLVCTPVRPCVRVP